MIKRRACWFVHGVFIAWHVFGWGISSLASERRAAGGQYKWARGGKAAEKSKKREKGKERENGEGLGAPSLMAPRQGKDKKGLGREKNSGSRRAGEAKRSRAGRAAQQREKRYLEAELVNRGSAPPFKGGRRRTAGSSFLMH